MTNLTQLELSNEVFHRLIGLDGRHQAATELIAGAAFQVGFTRIAAGLAFWSEEHAGPAEMASRLADEQFNVLAMAPIDFSSRTAKTAIDLCAAAAYRLNDGETRRHSLESDVNHLQKAVDGGRVTLRSHEHEWLKFLISSSEWQLLHRIRNLVTHHAIRTASQIGLEHEPRTQITVGDDTYEAHYLAHQFSGFTEARFHDFTDAVLADFPAAPV